MGATDSIGNVSLTSAVGDNERFRGVVNTPSTMWGSTEEKKRQIALFVGGAGEDICSFLKILSQCPNKFVDILFHLVFLDCVGIFRYF